MPDGSLLIADDEADVIYRVTYRAKSEGARTRWKESPGASASPDFPAPAAVSSMSPFPRVLRLFRYGVLLALCSWTVVAIAGIPAIAFAQDDAPRRLEVGGFLGAIDLRESVGEKPFAIGLRAGYRVAPWLGFETELTRCPEDPSHNFGETMLLAGGKAGLVRKRVGVLARVRGGSIWFGPHYSVNNGGRRHHPKSVVDVGATVEWHVSPRATLRIDWGRLIIPFDDEPMRGPLPPYVRRLGSTTNGVGSIGVQFNF